MEQIDVVVMRRDMMPSSRNLFCLLLVLAFGSFVLAKLPPSVRVGELPLCCYYTCYNVHNLSFIGTCCGHF